MRTQARIAVIGTNKTGKTTYAIEFAKDAISKDRKVFIFNLGGEKKWYDLAKPVPREKWHKEKIIHVDSSFLSIRNKITPSVLIEYFLQFIVEKEIKHGLIIIDDAAGVIPAQKMEYLKICMIQSRQKDLDYLLLFHSLNEIPNSIVSNITHYAVGYTRGVNNTAQNKIPLSVIKLSEKINNFIETKGGFIEKGENNYLRKIIAV